MDTNKVVEKLETPVMVVVPLDSLVNHPRNYKKHPPKQIAKLKADILRQYSPGSVFERDLDEHEAPFVYLCGVTSVHDENLHIAMRYAPGQSIEYEDANIKVVARDAERLPIEPVDLPLPKEFTTCRNFQFGYHYFP